MMECICWKSPLRQIHSHSGINSRRELNWPQRRNVAGADASPALWPSRNFFIDRVDALGKEPANPSREFPLLHFVVRIWSNYGRPACRSFGTLIANNPRQGIEARKPNLVERRRHARLISQRRRTDYYRWRHCCYRGNDRW